MRGFSIVVLLVVVTGLVSARDGTAMSTSATKVLVFQREESGDPPVYGIWRAHTDGSHQVRLTRGQLPRVSPDGRLVAFLRPARSGQSSELWVMPVKGGKAVMLRSSRTGFTPPVWSPDSRMIAVADASGFAVIDAASGEVRNSRPAQGEAVGQLTFSPAGDRLAFVWVALGGSGVDVLRLADGHVAMISRNHRSGGYLAWGPDDSVAFTCGEGDVCVAAADGTRYTEYPLASSLRRLGALPRAWTRGGALVLEIPPSHNGRLIHFDLASGRARYLTPWIGGLDALGIGSGGQWMLATTGHGEFGLCNAGVVERISVETGRRRVLVTHACDGSWNA